MLLRALQQARRAAVLSPWPQLNELFGASPPSTGQMVLLMGAPGVGKSMVALAWALTVTPSLVVSHDTDLQTQRNRAIHQIKGRRLSAGVVDQIWLTDAPKNPHEVAEVLEALQELWGRYPRFVVIDNLGDLLTREESAAAYEEVIKALRSIARHCDCLLLALHHVRRREGDGRNGDLLGQGRAPVTLTQGAYAGEKRCDIVLGMWHAYGEGVNIALLKHRHGHADSGAGLLTYIPKRDIWLEEDR